MIGVVCHEHVGPPRTWSESDREFARTIADLVVARMQAAEAQLARQSAGFNPADSERAETMGRLAAGVAHDFKNLLLVILGNARLIASRPDLPGDVLVQVVERPYLNAHTAFLLKLPHKAFRRRFAEFKPAAGWQPQPSGRTNTLVPRQQQAALAL